MIFFTLILNALLLCSLVLWLWLREKDQTLKPFFFPALVLKLMCGVGVGWLYFYYYPYGDTYVFQKHATILSEYAKASPIPYIKILFWGEITDERLRLLLNLNQYSKALSFIKIVSLFNFLTHSNYYLNGLYFSFFSFTGSWFLVRNLKKVYPETGLAAVAAFLFVPSVVFWSSGILKESLLMACITALTAIFLRVCYGKYRFLVMEIVFGFCLMLLIWDIKFFVGGILFPVLFSWLFIKWIQKKTTALQSFPLQVFSFFLILGIGIVGAMLLHPVLGSVNFLLHELVSVYHDLAGRSPGLTLQYNHLKPELISFLKYAPQAVFNTFFRPFLGEGSSVIWWLQGLENLVIAFLATLYLAALVTRRKPVINLFLVAVLVYSLILAAVFGISTPNLGTLSRYRIVFLPFIIYLLLQNPLIYRFLAKFRRNV